MTMQIMCVWEKLVHEVMKAGARDPGIPTPGMKEASRSQGGLGRAVCHSLRLPTLHAIHRSSASGKSPVTMQTNPHRGQSYLTQKEAWGSPNQDPGLRRVTSNSSHGSLRSRSARSEFAVTCTSHQLLLSPLQTDTG